MLLIAVGCAENCSTWFYPAGDGQCVCGSRLGTVIVCNNETQDGRAHIGVLDSYCLTSNGDDSNTNVVGKCLAALTHGERMLSRVGLYKKVLPDIMEQEAYTCEYLNRKGRLCGQCKPNHRVSAYSYDIKCHPCTSSLWSGIVQYICVAYFPLTVFLCIVLVFRISVTSPAMNVPVLCCQLFSLPFVLQYLMQCGRKFRKTFVIFMKVLVTTYGIWNLDFFRVFIPPICLPLNTMQLIALDYLVALYPLLLLACIFMLVTAHDRGCRLVVRLWRPFFWCTARLRQQWRIRHSIIDAFATFFLLSQIKLLDTSVNLLVPINIRNQYGSSVGHYLYNDASITFLGSQHWPYAVLALFFVFMVILFPVLLLLLYPMLWFQKCLNKCGLNSPGLRIFMQCFQGYYRDKTDDGWECRYFAAVYPTFRIATYIVYSVTISDTFFVAFILLCFCVIVIIIIVQPYKTPYIRYNKQDAVIIFSLVVAAIGNIEADIAIDVQQINPNFAFAIVYASTILPLLYFTLKAFQFLFMYFRLKVSRRNQQGETELLIN